MFSYDRKLDQQFDGIRSSLIGGDVGPVAYTKLDDIRTENCQLFNVCVRIERFTEGAVPTQVGEVHDGAIWSSGRRGYLLFGPYRSLEAGTYRLRIRGETEEPTEAWADVVSDKGRTVHARVRIHDEQPEEFGLLVETLVELPYPVTDVEVRFFVDGHDTVRVDGYELRLLDPVQDGNEGSAGPESVVMSTSSI